jgi:leader peptidase (prepilin peptidase)/N-methyltransferase
VSAVPLVAAPRRRRATEEATLTALLALGSVLAAGPRPALLGLLWLAAVTPRLVAVDIAEHRLPDRVVLPGWPVALAAALLEAAAGGTPVLVALAAGAGYGALLLVLHVAGGMGFGDVKLAPVLGLAAAAVTPAAAVAAPLLAFLAGGVVAVVALARSGRGARIPFGPAMLLGAWAAVLLV